jgi:predicted MFS family arabinose efflux permease
MTLGYVMVNKNCGHKARGSIMGINCLFGAVGILIIAQGGGYAFDLIDKSVPFLFSAFLSLVLFIIVIFKRTSINKKSQVGGCPVNHGEKEQIRSQESDVKTKGDEKKGEM